MTGSALPSSAKSTITSGTESKAPLMIDRDRGDETELGASATSRAVVVTTRNGARKGTAISSLAERSLHFSAPRVIVARPNSMASLKTIRPLKGSVLVNANPKLSTVAQATSTRSGVSTRPTATNRDRMRETDAAETQIGQLMPASAANRIAAPSADVSIAAVQATVEANDRIDLARVEGQSTLHYKVRRRKTGFDTGLREESAY